MRKALDLFFSKNPALFYGLSSLCSFSFAIDRSPHVFSLLIVLSLLSAKGNKRLSTRLILVWTLNILVFIYGVVCFRLPVLKEKDIQGTICFQPTKIFQNSSSFSKRFVYQGIGKYFIPKNPLDFPQAKNFPCSVKLPKGKQRPLANKLFWIEGRLSQTQNGNYVFTSSTLKPWFPKRVSLCFAEKRWQIKKNIASFLQKRISCERSASFLTGMITGTFEDQMMQSAFGKVGLLHLMAISGFHFALLLQIASFFLRLVLSKKQASWLVLFLIIAYFIFLGPTPSIVRAFFMSFTALLGWLFEKRAKALNTLGVSFLLILVFDPLLIRSIGFLFSASVTASILLFYPLTKVLMDTIMDKRLFHQVKAMPFFDQHCYCLLYFLREGLALLLAVNVIALPLTLFYFHTFPLLSLIYNLFIPFMVSLSLFFVTFATLSFWIFSPFGDLAFQLTSTFTHFILNLIYQLPPSLNVYLQVKEFPQFLLFLYVSLAFLMGVYYNAGKQPIDFYSNLDTI